MRLSYTLCSSQSAYLPGDNQLLFLVYTPEKLYIGKNWLIYIYIWICTIINVYTYMLIIIVDYV